MAGDEPIRGVRETSPASDSQPAKTNMALLLSLIDNGSIIHVDDDNDSKPMREAEPPPASDSQPAKAEMGQNMALVLYLPDNGSSIQDDCFNPMREAETPPASDSQPATAEMGQNMALVLYLPDNGSSIHDDSFNLRNEERAIDFAEQSMDGDDYVPPPPLRIVRPESPENGQEKCPGFRYEERARKSTTKNTSTGIFYTRRGRPSAKSKMGQKPALFDTSCGSSSYSKDENEDDFEPPTPTRKRGRPSRSKTGKRKMEQEPLLFDSSSSSHGRKENDFDFEPEVSDDDVRKKYARVKGSAWDRAEEVMKKLPEESCFIKCMKHSQVVQGFWLGLPAGFCRNNIPEEDVNIVLEDEEGQTCDTNYKAYKTGLSGGWKGFAKQHDLKVGDALVFQLVQPTRFKVYILRENMLSTTDGALGLLSLDTSTDNTTPKKKEKESCDNYTMPKKGPRKEKQKFVEVVTRVRSNPSSNDSDDLTSEEAAGGSMGSPGLGTGDFVAMKSHVNFKIVVGDDHVVLPDHLHMRYYELCHVRRAFLHRHLPKHICSKLATWMIAQTVNIAEGIMNSSVASLEDLTAWKKTLESVESLGMEVAFMRKRVDELIDLIGAPSSTMEETKGYEKLKVERARLTKKARRIASRLSTLKDDMRKMEEMAEVSAKKKEEAVRKLATEPW